MPKNVSVETVTMASQGSRKRLYRHRVRCDECKKELNSDNKETHVKSKHNGKNVNFTIIQDAKQPKLNFEIPKQKDTSTSSSATIVCVTEEQDPQVVVEAVQADSVAEPASSSNDKLIASSSDQGDFINYIFIII